MKRVLAILGLLGLLVSSVQAFAAGNQAEDLRKQNDLVPYAAPEKFLSGHFVADESDPAFIFGTVQAFAASRKCPTAWLIEQGEKKRLDAKGAEAPLEYTLYLEEACPDKVVYYVFVDQSALTPKQWIDWRQQFHKSKADAEYAKGKAKLEHALAQGVGVAGELRFTQVNGELSAKSPEEVLRVDLHFQPVYDLNQDKKLSQ